MGWSGRDGRLVSFLAQEQHLPGMKHQCPRDQVLGSARSVGDGGLEICAFFPTARIRARVRGLGFMG